jgi:hypothetical protein
MRGAHRGPVGASAGKNARWLAILAALVIVPLAAIAGLIWFFASATNLEWTAVLLIFGVIQLVQALAWGKPEMAWVGACGVIVFGWGLVSDVTHHPDGGLAGFLVQAVSLVCLGIGTVLLARKTRLGQMWKALRARLASGPGDNGPASPG